MGIWRQLARGVRSLLNGRAADREVDDELDHYLEEATSALVRDGLTPGEARRAARLAVGNPRTIREEVRTSGWESVVGESMADFRYGARRLRRTPGFTIVGALTLALGIGASTAIFSAVNPILFESLPYPDAARLVMIWDSAGDGSRLDVAFGTYREIVERATTFETVAAMKAWQPTLTGAGVPERLEGQRVSFAYFRTLGIMPALGRDLRDDEDRVRGPRVAILADRLWRRRFGGDPSIVGREIALDDAAYLVVGVMPAAFENVLEPSAEIWTPLQYDSALPVAGREWGHHLHMAGRLRPGVRAADAAAELAGIARHPIAAFSRPRWASLQRGLTIDLLQHEMTRDVKPALVAVTGAVLLLLAVASVNVTNLLLARGAQRRPEMAMRVALGAARSRMIRQLVAESLLLSGLGGLMGVAAASAGVRALVALGPPGLPRAGAIGIDGTVLFFALGLTTLVGIAIGLMPALQATRGDLHTAMVRAGRHTTSRHRLTRRALVVAEVALALVLLVSAGLLLRSLQRLFAISPGFDVSHVLSMQLQTSGRTDVAATRQLLAAALESAGRVPGVSSAAITSQLPLSGDYNEFGVSFEAERDETPRGFPAFRYAVSPGYFDAMRIPLRRGRLLGSHDTRDAPRAVLISESFAAKLPGGDPVGQRLHIGATDQPWYTVVGVVGDVKQMSLAANRPDAVYTTIDQWPTPDSVMWLVVRVHDDAAARAPAVIQAVWAVNKDQAVSRVATMSDRLEATAAERRFALVLFEAFAIVALVLAATGIYGVLSGSVTERTREIGVRAALGATRASIVKLVVGEGLTLAAIGVALGLVGAVVSSRALVTLLFSLSPLDPATYVAVIAVLAGVAGMASVIPAWRAAWVDPSITLRSE